ncbi:MAG TPA: tRNA (adenosine(37)-N6)-dimethylallyltransferase MiaA [Chloroflexota bacterium]|nr:tRNA (adenosine(37)-N6)-dimethylallyltransferase MiaA [Chloroflexota bacterium]
MKPLVAIVGPTASGKSAFALRLARRLPGAEIIAADSRQVYRGLDIGTAKPTLEQQALVPHRLIDLVDPDQPFSLADYQRLAYQAIDAVDKPFLVGGTGLYVQAVVDGFVLPSAPPDPALRGANLSREQLLQRLRELDPSTAETIDRANRYRLLRAVERAGRPLGAQPRYQVLRIGLSAPRDELYRRADERIERMLEAGWLDEVQRLLARYQPDLPALSGLGYGELVRHLQGELAYDEAVAVAKRRTRQFVKRQQTWFKRDARIHWFNITQPGWMAQATELVGTLWRLPV